MMARVLARALVHSGCRPTPMPLPVPRQQYV
jgi:hypothetical protein